MKMIWHFLQGASLGMLVWIAVNFKLIGEMSKYTTNMPPDMSRELQLYLVVGGMIGAIFFQFGD